jgi:YD repeat-containing protein
VRKLALLVALFAAFAALGQKSADTRRGFDPNDVYYVHDIDTINSFSGTLTLRIPIGAQYPVAEGFSYGLALHWNQNLWLMENVRDDEADWSTPSGPDSCSRADGVEVMRPSPHSNAGMGWTLSLGRMLGGMYETPDGAQHQFYETLDPVSAEPTTSDGVLYTRDRSFLRMKLVSDSVRTIEFPDGSIHTFERPACGGGWWLPTRMTDGYSGNWLQIAYEAEMDREAYRWILTDSHGRQHVVRFKRAAWDKAGPHYVVDWIKLQTFNGGDAVYNFTYDQRTVNRPKSREHCYDFVTETPIVQFLAGITLPVDPTMPGEAATGYEFSYLTGGTDDYFVNLPGQAKLPTGGTIRWGWGPYEPAYPYDPTAQPTTWGIVARQLHVFGEAAPYATWNYAISRHADDLTPSTFDYVRDKRNLATDPSGTRTATYFSISTTDDPSQAHPGVTWQKDDYGKPFTRRFQDSTGTRFLSEVTYPATGEIDIEAPLTNALRAKYVEYEPEDAYPDNYPGEKYFRVKSTRVLHFQNGNVVSDVITDLSGYDGLGNHRTTTVRPGPTMPAASKTKITTTAFNSDRTTPNAVFPTDRRWITGTFSHSETTYDGQTARTDVCFDANGLLRRKRTWRIDGDRTKDFLVELTDANGDGDVDLEEYWGGDEQSLPANFDTCTLSTRPPIAPRYTIRHTYQNGVRNSTKHDGVAFLSLDLTIDKSGLPRVSRDSAKVETAFVFNNRGQLRKVSPAGDAVTEYEYVVTPGQTPAATVTATQKDGATELTRSHHYYDGFGRLIQQRQKMPLAEGKQWAVTSITYDALSRPVRRHVARPATSGDFAVIPGTPATVTEFEPLGRPAKITSPDGSSTEFFYRGAAEIDRRTEFNSEPSKTAVTTREFYDVHGQLYAITEGMLDPSDPGSGQTTEYQYDEGGRLGRVIQGVQERAFHYDHAGLLTSEVHPENGQTDYRYDARGHVIWRKDARPVEMTYTYNAAEQLTKVDHVQGIALVPLKAFTYDPATGRMLTAKRHNYRLDLGGDVAVTESFTYHPVHGRLSEKTTTVTSPDETKFDGATFTDAYRYDKLGAVDLLTYPSCTNCGTLAAPSRSVATTYENGYVTGVNGYTMAGGILYNANGLVRSIQHQNTGGGAGPLWEQLIAAHGMARPEVTRISNVCSDLKIDDASMPADKSVTWNTAADLTPPATAATRFEWYEVGSPAVIGTANRLDVPVTRTMRVFLRAFNATCSVDSRVFTLTVAGCTPEPPVIAAAGEIHPGQIVTASIPTGAAFYEWSIEGGAFTQPNPATNTVSFTTASCTAGTVTLRVRTNCHEWVTRTVIIVPPSVVVVDEPKSIVRTESATIRARFTGQLPWTATWSDGHVDSQINVAEHTRTVTPSATTAYSIVSAASHGCNITPSGSVTVTVEECRPIRKQPADVTVQSGGTARFTVEAEPGATFRWYEGTSGDTSKPVGGTTSALEITNVTRTSYYWCRVTSPRGCSEDTRTAAATICSDGSIAGPLQNYPDPPIRMVPGKETTFDVSTTGSVIAHQWRVALVTGSAGVWSEGTIVSTSSTPRLTWAAPAYKQPTAANPNPVNTYGVYVSVGGSCMAGAITERLIKVIEVVQPSACITPDVLGYLGAEVGVGLNGQVLLSASVVDNDGIGLADPATLDYKWFVDGKPLLRTDGSPFTNDQYTPQVETTQTVTIEITRKAATCTGSPTARVTMFLYNDLTCPVPPLSVNRIAVGPNDLGDNRVLRAYSPWPSVTFQWYRGDSGDTREPLTAGPSFTVPPDDVNTYWVRATSPCGTTADSATMIATTATCTPVRIVAQPQPANVNAGTDHVLALEAVGNPSPSVFNWFEVGNATGIGNQKSVTVRPNKTTTYWARVANGCHLAVSLPATLTVVSCNDITVATPPQNAFITEDPADPAASLTVGASTSGSTLEYQWFEGERGDTSKPAGARTSNPGLTVKPAKTTRYWVRVARVNGCEIDLAAVTVYVCRTPKIVTPYQTSFSSPGPAWNHKLTVPATGDNLSYQWYAGAKGDTSAPVWSGATFTASPNRTTIYWCRVTSDCTGKPDRYADSALFTVTVCPLITTQPYATKSEVMPNTAPVLNIAVDRVASPAQDIKWYRGNVGDTTNYLGGGTSLTAAAITADTTYWAQVISGSCVIDSNPVTVKVCTSPSVRWHSSARAQVKMNESQVLYLDPTTSTTLTYNWYASADTNFANAQLVSGPGATNITLTTGPATAKKTYWARVEEPSGCYAITQPLTVDPCIPTIATQPQPAMIDSGGNTTLTVTATGSASRYQWYRGASGDTSNPIAGATNASLNVAPTADTTYWVRVTGCEPAVSVDSAAATVSLCKVPSIAVQPASVTASAPSVNTTLSVNASGTELAYQWYTGASGVTTSPISGATGSSVVVSPAVTTSYWVRVSGRCGTALSSTAAKVSVPPAITTQPTGGWTMPGTTHTLLVAASGNELRYQWFKNSVEISGATADRYVAQAGDGSYFVRVWSANAYRDSNTVTLSLCVKPTVAWSSSVRTAVAHGESQTLSLNASSSGSYSVSYTWYSGDSGNVAGSTLLSGPGATNISHGIAPTATTKYWVRVSESNGCYADTPTLTVNVCIPTITAQPTPAVMIDKISNPSASATLSVAANGGALTYQWYIGAPGVTTNPIPGATSSSYAASPNSDTTYWVRVTGSCGASKDSAASTVTLCKAPAIGSHPASVTANANASTTLSVGATGTDLTYQWYIGPSGVTTSPISGATGPSYVAAPSVTTDYWVKVSGRCGAAVSSNAAKISVAPTITSHPTGGWSMPGGTHTLLVVASGTELRYQWFRNSVAISGATSDRYHAPAADATYYVRVWSGNAYRDSNTATVSVCVKPTAGWSNTVPPRTSVREAESQTLYLNVSSSGNYAVSYTWYSGDSGNVAGSTRLSGPGATNSSLSIAPAVTTKYWARVSEANGCYSDTPTLTVSVCIPAIVTQPPGSVMIDKTSNPSASTTLSVAANGGALTYQWYIGASGVTTSPISGATSTSYVASPNSDTTYWVRVTGSCGVAADSTAATVQVCRPPGISAQPQSSTTTANTNVQLGVTAAGTDLTYQWYIGPSGVTTSPITGATASTYTTSPGTTTDYWVKVSGRCGAAVNSNTAKLSVAPTVTTQPAGGSVTKGSTRTVTVAASGTQLSYEWFLGAGTTTRVATTASYTTPPLNADAIYWARVWSGGAYRDSAQAVFTVCQPRAASVSNNTMVSGANVSLSISGSGTDETYTWYRGESGDTANPAGYTASITVAPLETTKYWVRTTRPACTADSAAVTVLVCYPKITTQPQSATINSGQQRTLTVAATGTPALSYQWYQGDSGVTTTPVGTGASFTTPALTSTAKYWVRVTTSSAACGATNYVNSGTATITVCSPPAIGIQPANRIVNSSSESTTLTVDATGDGLSYQWYEGSAGVTTTPVGTNESSLTVTPVTTRSYWVRVTGTCGTANSSAALVSVKPNITAHPSPVNTTVCKGSTVNYSVTAHGNPLTYRWYRQLSGASTPELIGTNASVGVAATGAMEVWCEVTSGNVTATSGHVFISVTEGPPVTAIGKSQPTATSWKLTPNVSNEDRPYVTWAWYSGAVGNTSGGMISNDPSLYYYSSNPASFWVRITSTVTGCWTDLGTTVP